MLCHLVNPVLAVLSQVDHHSLHKKRNSVVGPVLYFKQCNPNQTHFVNTRRRKQSKRRYIKPKPLSHLTTKGHTLIRKVLLLLTIKEEHGFIISIATRNISIIQENFRKWF